MPISKVLIANRGEIAVRIARACTDFGIGSVAVYAEPDRDALHVKVADEAYALGGSTPGDSYLLQDKLIEIAQESGADAIHPGYGFLAENGPFAQKVIEAGLVWIGPGPEAIDSLGDKVKARHIALEADAPLVPGTKDPVSGPDEVVEFAKEHGLPVAIKAAYGGGGRGLKVARTMEEIPELYESAVREAVTAFGRGECFVERFLDRPRHVETQCLADQHGNVVVVSTRDCSLQRRNQKLVEEAPAPFLTEEQHTELLRASKAILKGAGYVGAGTCEFLVGPEGDISFLEVNTRLQVEHPVTEEVTGVDLVREQFKIANGEALSFTDPEPHAHSFEFRINGEDAGRGFLPQPGTVTKMTVPHGPGVRWDAGIVEGDTVAGAFDSMIAKLIVTGATRQQAIERSRRALAELHIEGMPTVTPFHRKVVADPDFAPADPQEKFKIHTRWIETEFDNDIEPYAGPSGEVPEAEERHNVVVEVGGKRIEVSLPGGLSLGGGGTVGGAKKKAPRRSSAAKSGQAASGDSLTAPMQGTIVKIAVEEGQEVAAGELILVLEAMKMEQPINAHKAGTITGLAAQVGATVTNGQVLAEIKD
ncbi:acetyl/propionyl/methylcrotonyl-CoA carboxylase subunit alpha [Nostocoides australiense]|nr:biotin carboxylase N-terminal domain-containing protein [Tetrasphaera australiensis]HRW01925.1 biotin carboxylase N-terminal domain-containing protein [Tetrasphaera sp.]